MHNDFHHINICLRIPYCHVIENMSSECLSSVYKRGECIWLLWVSNFISRSLYVWFSFYFKKSYRISAMLYAKCVHEYASPVPFQWVLGIESYREFGSCPYGVLVFSAHILLSDEILPQLGFVHNVISSFWRFSFKWRSLLISCYRIEYCPSLIWVCSFFSYYSAIGSLVVSYPTLLFTLSLLDIKFMNLLILCHVESYLRNTLLFLVV